MFVDRIPNRNSNPTWLVRESKWIHGKAVKHTIANITKLPQEVIQGIRILLKGGFAVKSLEDLFCIQSNKPHGHVAAVLGTMKQLNIASLIAPKNSRYRRVILGMIAARVLYPCPKLATSTMLDVETAPDTLNEELALKRVDADDLYDAMDVLVKRKSKIEKELAKRHIQNGSIVLYDVTSSYVVGNHNELADYGYSRDGRPDQKQIVIGLLTDQAGCPVSVEVFPGNTDDPKTVPSQVKKLRETFGINHVVMVGDRGMLKQECIENDLMPVGLDWITAMKKCEIRNVVEQGAVQMSLFDEQDLMEVTSELYPGERIALCRNPLLAQAGKEKREALLKKVEDRFDKIIQNIENRRLKDPAKIGIRVGRIFKKYPVRKYFTLDIQERHFSYTRNEVAIQKKAVLDGIYAIRTSLEQDPSATEIVANYKQLSLVELAFRTMKTISIKIRPIHHRRKERVIAHVFLCMLAYYVEFHMRKKLAPILFADSEPKEECTEGVPTASRSFQAKKKASKKRTETGDKVSSFATLMKTLSGLSRMKAVPNIAKDPANEVTLMDSLTPTQKRAFDLLQIRVK